MRTFALAAFAVLLATPLAATQVGQDRAKEKSFAAKPIRTAAIHPRNEPANLARDPVGRPLASGPITRLAPTRTAISELQVSPDGRLTLKGYGLPGTRVLLVMNRVRLAAITVNDNSRWQVAPQLRLLPGNYRFSLEDQQDGILGNLIADELRLSVPAERNGPINIQFKPDEALQRQAEKIGEEASKVFDKFFQDKAEPARRVAQANRSRTDETTQSDQPILDATIGWLGTANEAYQNQIVPRLQVGGALSLPNDLTERVRSRNIEISAWSLPSVDGVTKEIQRWFGRSADSYDGQIIPRLSGARERRIVIQRPVDAEVVEAPKTVDDREVARRAADERRLAELRRQQERDNERLRRQREEQSQFEAEQARLAAERERAQARERRLAAQRAEQARLDQERRRTEEELAKAEAARLRAAAERKRAEDAQRSAELATQQRIDAERQRINNELLERKRQRERAIAQARAERERARKIIEDARRARESARQRELARIRQEREQRQAEEEQQNTRLSQLWQKAKRAAREAMARGRAERDPANQLAERNARREIQVARRNARATPPELPTQNRYRNVRRTPRTVNRTPLPIPNRDRLRDRQPERTKVAVRLPVRKTAQVRSSKRQLSRPLRTVQATKTATPAQPTSRQPKRSRVASKARNRRKKRVLSYRRRSHPCRKKSARRIRLPGKYVVRKGDSLWRISKRHYHRGHRYWRIYRANLGKIRNPDLIYPCQRFYIPKRKSRRK